jgi:DNA-binding Lrp family transcriptional regulator
MLFGIRTEGQLGGRSELVEAYEIFKNTYINDKQQAIEEVANVLLPLIGQTQSKIEAVEPISDRLNPTDFVDILPQEWVFEKLGIDIDKYQPADSVPIAQGVNENLKNLSGRQMQQLQRVLSKYKNGKLTKPEATLLLKNSYGIGDDDINMLLSNQNFSKVYGEEEVAMMFEEIGEIKQNYHIVKSMRFDEVDMSFTDLSQTDANIVDQIRKDKRATAQAIADAIKSTAGYVQKRIDDLKKSGVLTQTSRTIGVDKIIETAINPEVIDYKPKAETVDVYVKYSYEVKPGAGPEVIPTTRPFCRKLLELDRLYTRAEIETISGRLGYSVFDRGGGFWGDKPSCRHEWRRNLVLKKRTN